VDWPNDGLVRVHEAASAINHVQSYRVYAFSISAGALFTFYITAVACVGNPLGLGSPSNYFWWSEKKSVISREYADTVARPFISLPGQMPRTFCTRWRGGRLWGGQRKNKYRIWYGGKVAEVKATQDQTFFVDVTALRKTKNLTWCACRDKDTGKYYFYACRLERKAAKEKFSRQSMQTMLERVQNEAHNTDYTDVEQFVLDHLPWEMESCKRCHAILDCFRANPACRNCGAR